MLPEGSPAPSGYPETARLTAMLPEEFREHLTSMEIQPLTAILQDGSKAHHISTETIRPTVTVQDGSKVPPAELLSAA